MKIILAKTAGFCMGVRRAMEIAVDAVRSGREPLRTQGPIIHNRQAVELLESRGIAPLADGETPNGGAVVIRAHGITPEEKRGLRETGWELIDATCPHVLLSQKRIAADSAAEKRIVLVGDRDHPEVRGLAGHAVTPVYIISSCEEAERLEPGGEFAAVGQTTFSQAAYDEICAVLRRRFPGCAVYDSICSATARRQEEARAVAARADTLVVVGGRHSANTRRLAEIGAETGKPVFLVETADELDPAAFSTLSSVGVTAGASTPGWLTQSVIDRLESFSRPTARNLLRRLARLAARARLTTALGAAGLSHASYKLLHAGTPSLRVLAMAAAYVFVAYTLNRRNPPGPAGRPQLPMDRFYESHRPALLLAALIAYVFSMVAAASLGTPALALMGLAHVFAVLYNEPLLPERFRSRRLRDFPASKDLAVALALAVVLVGEVVLSLPEGLAAFSLKRVVGTGGIIFFLVFAKTVMLDLRDIESDHLIGIETLPVAIGGRRATRLVYIVQWGLFALILALGITGHAGAFALVFSVVPLYGAFVLYHLARAHFRGEVNCQLAVDSQLLLAGAVSLLWDAGAKLL